MATTVGTRAAGPSLKPALVVLGLAILLVVGGALLSIVGSTRAPTGAIPGPVGRLPGAHLRSQPAAPLVARIAANGEPPADITRALYVPAGSRYVGTYDDSAGIGPFDRTVYLSVSDPEKAVAAFFQRMLSDEKWVTSSISHPSSGSTEVLATHSSADGYQWSVGIISKGVGELVSPALAGGGASAARTNVSIELYQVEDNS